MKKQMVLFMAAVMAAGLLAGCGRNTTTEEQNGTGTTTENNTANNGTNNGTTENNMTGTENGAAAMTNYRMGLGVVSRLKNATHAGETEGSIEVETVMAAVTVDEDDRIMNCKIDMVEHKIPVSNTGSIGTQANTEYQTKKELGSNYGMAAASGIGKEWYEQAEAFEQQVIGRTVNDIKGINTDTNGYAQDAEWNSSVTISISDFQAAIVKAVENAR